MSRASMGTAFLIALLACSPGWAQKPEYDFGIEEQFAAKQRNGGLAESQVARRLWLVRSIRTALEDDYWRRFYP